MRRRRETNTQVPRESLARACQRGASSTRSKQAVGGGGVECVECEHTYIFCNQLTHRVRQAKQCRKRRAHGAHTRQGRKRAQEGYRRRVGPEGLVEAARGQRRATKNGLFVAILQVSRYFAPLFPPSNPRFSFVYLVCCLLAFFCTCVCLFLTLAHKCWKRERGGDGRGKTRVWRNTEAQRTQELRHSWV